MSVHDAPPLSLISITPPSQNVPPEVSNEYACWNVKLKGPPPTTSGGEMSDWSEISPGSGPWKRWDVGVTSWRTHGWPVAGTAALMVHGGTRASTLSLTEGTSSTLPRVL